MTKTPWYRDGLQFKCTQCGDCCTGAPGYVWVNQGEMEAIAELIGEEDMTEFKRKYTVKIGFRRSLRELPKSFDCVFLDADSRRCTVYGARPRQCRTWPFWESNLKSPEAWQRTCRECPGAGTGELYQLDEIEDRRKTFNV